MSEDKDQKATEWLSRLRTRSVTNADIAEFARWRRIPGNAEAYRRAEAFWEDIDPLQHDPDVALAIRSALRSRRTRTKPMVIAGGMLAAGLLLLLALSVFRPGVREQRYATAIGERSSVELADGSKVEVDSDSEVQALLERKSRRVDLLRGQALFAVRHDAARPFVVATPAGVTVTALGTRFDVQVKPDGSVAVTLLEGRVAVRQRGRLLAELEAGEALLVKAQSVERLRPDIASDSVDWTRGRLIFRDEPLRDAVAEINRYSTMPIIISTGDVATEPVSGEFSTDDPEGFVRAVNALLGSDVLHRRSGA